MTLRGLLAVSENELPVKMPSKPWKWGEQVPVSNPLAARKPSTRLTGKKSSSCAEGDDNIDDGPLPIPRPSDLVKRGQGDERLPSPAHLNDNGRQKHIDCKMATNAECKYQRPKRL